MIGSNFHPAVLSRSSSLACKSLGGLASGIGSKRRVWGTLACLLGVLGSGLISTLVLPANKDDFPGVDLILSFFFDGLEVVKSLCLGVLGVLFVLFVEGDREGV
jgi:hypothetical protein